MRVRLCLSAILGLVALAGTAEAGAWPIAPGEGQAILKYERGVADRGFDPDGALVDIVRRRDDYLSLFVEYGLTERLTVQGRAGLTRGRDAFVDYEGRGPSEVGLRWAVRRDPDLPVSLYLGVIEPGEGRNGGYPAPEANGPDYEARILVGRTATWRGRPAFAEAQLGWIARDGLPDEARLDATLGWHVRPRWLLLGQTYAGTSSGDDYRADFLKAELSVVRELGDDWRLQAGWRATVAGREAPADHGPVLALWRRF